MAILDAARDAQVTDYAESVLEGFPASLMSGIVSRRQRTETDKNVVSALSSLAAQFQ